MILADVNAVEEKAGRLSGLDFPFLYRETEDDPQSVINVYIVDQRSSSAMSQAQLERWISERAPLIKEFRCRLHRIPLEISSPEWVRASDLQMSEHVFVSQLAGSGWPALRRRLSEIAGRRLDLRRPPWEIHLLNGITGVSGLPDGASAFIVKIHHAVCDGIRSAEIGELLLGDISKFPGGWEAQARSSTGCTVRGAIREIPAQWRFFRWGMRRLKDAREELNQATRDGKIAAPISARPLTRFNRGASRQRSVGAVKFSMADVQSARKLVPGATLNDVMLAVVAGALRKCLRELDELPAESLATLVPKSIRGLHSCAAANQVLPMIVDLHTIVSDPMDRMRRICDSVQSEKRRKEYPAVLAALDGVAAVPASLARLQFWFERSGRQPQAVSVNTSVSNYVRDASGLCLGEAPVVAVSCVPLLDFEVRLAHMVASVADVVTLTFTIDMTAGVDPDHYAQLLAESFGDLGGEAHVVGSARI